jgi:hypothetical protein
MNENIVGSNDIFHCKSITTHFNFGQKSSQFAKAKTGFVRLSKNVFKFSYQVELYQGNKMVENLKPVDSFSVSCLRCFKLLIFSRCVLLFLDS